MAQLTLADIKQNPQIQEFIRQTELKLNAMNYTDHGKRHIQIVSDRAMKIARNLNFSSEEVEYAGIAGYCHDMGNFLDRKLHHYWASLLFHQLYQGQTDDFEGVSAIMQAIANHDKDEARLTNNISAALIIADKSDVHRDRVREKDKTKIEQDIHNRVNFSVKKSDLDVDANNKKISLILELDTKLTSIMDYFEIFLGRMKYCKASATYLGCEFKLIINDTTVL